MNRKVTLKIVFICVVMSLMLVASCGKKKIDTGAAGAAEGGVSDYSADSVVDDGTTASTDYAGSESAAGMTEKGRESGKTAGRSSSSSGGAFDENNTVYFNFDSSDILDSEMATLENKAAWMKANPSAKITIEGHCDERGTSEYNLALGDRRAARAKSFLKKLGISGDRMDTISYGEEKPAALGHNEEAWAKNRRAYLNDK